MPSSCMINVPFASVIPSDASTKSWAAEAVCIEYMKPEKAEANKTEGTVMSLMLQESYGNYIC